MTAGFQLAICTTAPLRTTRNMTPGWVILVAHRRHSWYSPIVSTAGSPSLDNRREPTQPTLSSDGPVVLVYLFGTPVHTDVRLSAIDVLPDCLLSRRPGRLAEGGGGDVRRVVLPVGLGDHAPERGRPSRV